jgi:hypothetical protein
VTSLANRSGRSQITHGTFRKSGLAQHLLIIFDVRHALREEERLAWQRLIRVIGHEVSNCVCHHPAHAGWSSRPFSHA